MKQPPEGLRLMEVHYRPKALQPVCSVPMYNCTEARKPQKDGAMSSTWGLTRRDGDCAAVTAEALRPAVRQAKRLKHHIQRSQWLLAP